MSLTPSPSHYEPVIRALRMKLGLPTLQAHNMVIRDERGWRINEKSIEYTWLVGIHHAFFKSLWLFSIKMAATPFRGIANPEQLLQGFIALRKDGTVEDHYVHQDLDNFDDPIRQQPTYDLFDANLGITIDGVHYDYLIFAPSTSIHMCLNNPNSQHWKQWEQELYTLGRRLTQQAGVVTWESLFG